MQDLYCREFILVLGNPMNPAPTDLIVVKGRVQNDNPIPDRFRELTCTRRSTQVAAVMTRAEIDELFHG